MVNAYFVFITSRAASPTEIAASVTVVPVP